MAVPPGTIMSVITNIVTSRRMGRLSNSGPADEAPPSDYSLLRPWEKKALVAAAVILATFLITMAILKAAS